MRYVKNILAGSFRAMIRQATADGFVTQDPFAGLKWPKPRTPEPDPFTAEERTRIIRWFAEKEFSFYAGRATEGPRRRPHPPYHAFVYVLFWTGLRPSESCNPSSECGHSPGQPRYFWLYLNYTRAASG